MKALQEQLGQAGERMPLPGHRRMHRQMPSVTPEITPAENQLI